MGSGDKTLYVFVDESGIVGRDSIYTVAGAWTLSTRNDLGQVLKPTAGRLETLLEGQGATPGKELKGSEYRPELLDLLLSSLRDVSLDDTTVFSSGAPWPPDIPVRFSIHEINQDLANEILEDILGSSLQVPISLQTIALSSILSPFVQPDALDTRALDECHVVLDADTWERARKKIDRGLGLIDDDLPAPLSLEIRDSQTTPGIQIADLAANTWARNLRTGDCETAVEAIHRARFRGRS